jgi:hypothetical protein
VVGRKEVASNLVPCSASVGPYRLKMKVCPDLLLQADERADIAQIIGDARGLRIISSRALVQIDTHGHRWPVQQIPLIPP